MTVVSQIISDALRQSNLIALGTSPTLAQQSEGLRFLNRIVRSVFGNEAGENLTPFPLGKLNIDRPQGFPWYNQQPSGQWYVPENYRLMANLQEPLTVYLHPMPDDGARVGVVDVAGNFATHNFTIDGNGRSIEGANSLVLSTNGTKEVWFYRADEGNWMKTTNLTESDTFPFPEEFDDMFITMLAMRLNPAYGRAMDQQSAMVLNRARTQFRARYKNNIPTRSEEGLLRYSKMDTLRNWWNWNDSYYNPNDLFNTGRPY